MNELLFFKPPESDAMASVCDYKFRGPLDEFPRQEITDPDYYWYANGVLHVPGFRSPHMKASMLYNIDGDDCILRGELLVLVRMMEKHLNTAQLTDHLLVPVRVLLHPLLSVMYMLMCSYLYSRSCYSPTWARSMDGSSRRISMARNSWCTTASSMISDMKRTPQPNSLPVGA